VVGYILSWILCLLCILGGAFLVLSFGLSFGNDKAYQFMVAVIVAFMASIFIFQPIKVRLMFPDHIGRLKIV
jgi:hypothetical protein